VCVLCFTLCAGESLVFLSCVRPVFYIVCWRVSGGLVWCSVQPVFC